MRGSWALRVRRMAVGAALLSAAVGCGRGMAQEPVECRDRGRVVGRLLDRLRETIAGRPSDRQADRAGQSEQPARLVLRLSEDFFVNVVDRDVDRLTPVQEVILGTPVVGQARTVGRPTVVLVPDQKEAVFEVMMTGTTVSRTTGRNRAAIIHSRATTHFRASKQIVFDPQRGFRTQPLAIEAQTQLVNEGIASTARLRLVDRIVRRRAWQEVQRGHAQAEAIAHDRAQGRIQRLIDQRLEQAVAQLNRATSLRSLLTALAPGESRLALVCCSTEDCVLVALTGREEIATGQALPVSLPQAPAAAGPLQLWIHSSLLESLRHAADRFPWAASWLSPWYPASPAATSAAFVKELAAVLIADQLPLAVHPAGEWVVVPLSGVGQQRLVRRATWR